MKNFERTSKKQLGQLLIERGVIDRKELDKAIQHQKQNGGLIGEILVKLGLATEKDIAQALTCQYGFPYLPLSNYTIAADIAKKLPEKVCREFCLIPIDNIGDSLTIAMSNPLNVQAAGEVESITGLTVHIFVSTSTEIISAIEKYFK